MRPTSREVDRTTAGALALQRVLALEGRNALSRVELAASELSRFGLAPGALERIAAIRDAVGELDSLLDKIERLSDPARDARVAAGSRLEDAWCAVRRRIEAVLAARDIRIELEGELVEALVAVPRPVVERLLMLWIRTAVAAVDREGVGGNGAEPLTLRLSSRAVAASRDGLHGGPDERGEGGVELVLRGRRRGQDLPLPVERAERVELEVALAEWQARFAETSDALGTRHIVWLPGSECDAC